MTDKERLVMIKNDNLIGAIEDLAIDDLYKNVDISKVIDDVLWLIGQAERVEELEEELNKQLETGYKIECHLYESNKQNKRYHEALEFYANQKHVRFKFYGNSEGDIIVDYGETARKALEGEK